MTSIIKVDTIQNSSGTSALSIGADGSLGVKGLSYRPAFYAVPASGSGLASGFSAGSTMRYGDAVTNVGNHYNPSTFEFTAPVAGLYFISASISPGNATSTNVWIGMRILKNGSNIASQGWELSHVDVVSGNNQYANLNHNCILNLVSGDVLKVVVPYNTFNGDVGYGHFAGYLIG